MKKKSIYEKIINRSIASNDNRADFSKTKDNENNDLIPIYRLTEDGYFFGARKPIDLIPVYETKLFGQNPLSSNDLRASLETLPPPNFNN